ncbi:hypothetical protein NL676_007928 [Syzygium grande]|nr:hypothetical protein NL676_007928 [Syzygium grande]
MSTEKRALAPTSSGQASLLKRPRVARTNQVWHRSERNQVPRSLLTEEDVRRVVREELERAKSHSTEYCQSCTGNALKDIVRSLENTVQKLEEAAELANSHSPHLRRDNAKSMAKSDARNLQLQLRTKLSLPIYTGNKLEGKGGACISVDLIDANTGCIVTSGPEASIKLDVVVLEGDFNKDDEDNWAQKEFENYMVKEREGKRPLLAGNLLVTLKGGVGVLGELIFTDNSSWNRSKMFRIGLKVASGYCGNTRIREAKTDAFTVKEHRGESYKKSYPPKSDDEVWRLEQIAKDGKIHKKTDIIAKNWDILVRHARTCEISWKLYLFYLDSMRKHGALFDADDQLVGLIKDRVYVATHRLSAQEKEHGDTIVKKALDNLNDVREFNGETFSGSMKKKSSSSFPSQVFEGQIENLTAVQRNLASQICAAPVSPEAPPAHVGLTAEGHNDVTASALPVQSQNTNLTNAVEFSVGEIPLELEPIFKYNSSVLNSPGDSGNTNFGLPTQSHDINIQYAMHSGMIDSWSPVDYMVSEHVLPTGPTYASISSFQSSSTLPLPEGILGMEDLRSPNSDDSTTNGFAGIQNPADDDEFFQTSRYYAASKRWMKIFLVLKWFCFIRKRRLRVVQLMNH